MSFCNMYWIIDFPLLEYYWTTIFRLSVSTFMSHIIFGMPTWYISVFFLYLCAIVFIWCHCCFICLKLWKKWIYFVFFNICCGLLIFAVFFADVVEKMFSGPLSIFCRCRCFPPWLWLIKGLDVKTVAHAMLVHIVNLSAKLVACFICPCPSSPSMIHF